MAKKKPQRRQQTQRRPVPTDCYFCVEKRDPDYKDYQALEKFVTDRKKILNRSRTGVCSKHQRALSREIKRARHLALLPFTASVK